MLARSFLIESSSKLLVTRTGIKAWTSLISGGSDNSLWSYLPLNDENFTLSNLNISEVSRPVLITFYVQQHWGLGKAEFEYLWGQSANLDQILCVATLGVGKDCIMF